MKKICFVTATRAEYGQMAPIMHKIKGNEKFTLQILATGTHLVESFGYTYREIESDGLTIDEKVEIQMNTDTKVGICKTMGIAMIGISDALNRLLPDIIDAIRHAITKMSILHFAFTEQYRNRIIQMGENPKRVFNVGALGVENAKNIKCLSKTEISSCLGININNKYKLITYHPTTRSYGTAKSEIDNLLSALECYEEYYYIFTKANSDPEGGIINKSIQEFVCRHSGKAILVDSLGTELYMNVMRYADIVMGNSSSIIVEAPSFKIPIINIGERQKGRLKSSAIVNCKAEQTDICNAIEYILTD